MPRPWSAAARRLRQLKGVKRKPPEPIRRWKMVRGDSVSAVTSRWRNRTKFSSGRSFSRKRQGKAGKTDRYRSKIEQSLCAGFEYGKKTRGETRKRAHVYLPMLALEVHAAARRLQRRLHCERSSASLFESGSRRPSGHVRKSGSLGSFSLF